MLIDFDKADFVPSGKYPIVIIGGGVIGLTLALELEDHFEKILVFETGGLEISEQKQADHAGLTRYYGIRSAHGDTYLRDMRLRYFGGTSNHWGGYCRPFDPIDFKERKWMNSPGWDVDFEEFYENMDKAGVYAGLEESDFYKVPPDIKRYPSLLNSRSVFEPTITKISQNLNFKERFLDRVTKSPTIHYFLNATATDCNLDRKTPYEIEAISFQSNHGKTVRIVSERYILCMGTAENVRLLLNTNRKKNVNIGNQGRMLGKGFMEHLYITNVGYGYRAGGQAPVREALRVVGVNTPSKYKTHVNFRLNDLFQERLRFQNHQIGISSSKRLDKASIQDLPINDQQIIDIVRQGKVSKNIIWKDEFNFRADLPANLNNHFSLSRQKDRFGRFQVNLLWGASIELKQSFTRFLELFAKEYARHANGRLRLTLDDPGVVWERNVTGGAHMMGGTMLASDPSRGVVSPDLRVHNTTNLFVCCSGVFPTAGSGLPTMNTIALAIRLARSIRSKQRI